MGGSNKLRKSLKQKSHSSGIAIKWEQWQGLLLASSAEGCPQKGGLLHDPAPVSATLELFYRAAKQVQAT